MLRILYCFWDQNYLQEVTILLECFIRVSDHSVTISKNIILLYSCYEVSIISQNINKLFLFGSHI